MNAKTGSQWFLMFEWKWLELAPPAAPPTVSVAKKTRSSCFKHLQMVMYQQLVSVQPSYCRGIKKTGQSWRCTANLPCRVGEHFPWKKKVLYSCRDRQDGSPVESVPCLAEEAARAGEPNASATGKRGVRGLAADLSARPRCLPARDATRVHGRGDRAIRVARSAWPPSGGACAAEAAALPGSPPPGSPPAPWPGSVLSMQLAFPFCLRQKREEKNLKTASSLPSSFLCPGWPREAPEGRAGQVFSLVLRLHSPVRGVLQGFVHLRKL